ncbi:hypothetical protein [Paludifilum halophilum]|uniref:Xylose isomerase-like TIM barrel domain-containing protein n=1 Tax=Paludifilum halophilum TaxID=1642702 RepID=A0A235B629_9BACL|nr:hypothetical protein [Paludifilum halophilum]OYD07681.1 hypothetical protein CHM34_09375 [Paludifilum halophilum]
MLFSNPLVAASTAELHELHQISNQDIKRTELQLPSTRYTREDLKDLFRTTDTAPVAFRAPEHLGLGKSRFSPEEWESWFHTVAPLFSGEPGYFVCHGATVALGEVFEFLDERPRDFNALHDYKTQYVENMIDQLRRLEEIAEPLGIQLLLENTPIGGDEYFEPGKERIHPALRTPRHLLRVAEATGTRVCFDTAHARITSNVFTYMHRSRSLFAAATEKEILNATRSWIQFYESIKDITGLVRLSYAVSWGDTPQTAHIPFPEAAYAELLDFAEQIDPETPVILAGGNSEHRLKQMLETLRELKKR